MAQEKNWEKEYRNPLFVTKGDKPQSDVLRFLRFCKKRRGGELNNLKILDLGCGTGRNANYLARLGNEAFGLEISPTALAIAKARAQEAGIEVAYSQRNIGEKLPFEDAFFDLVLDVTSSNALNEKERETYLHETSRVLKKDGYFFVRALCKDGDKNAKQLLAAFPGREKDTYVMPASGLVERVFTQQDLRQAYGEFFDFLQLDKKSGYTSFDGQPYKRNYWLAYLQKKA